MESRKKENFILTCFIVYGCLIFAASCLPVIFDWSNTIEPWVLGVPFASFWQLLLSTLGIVGIGVYYLIEDAMGTLDLDVEKGNYEDL